MQSAVILKAIK